MLGTNGIGGVWLDALPPALPLVADTFHTLGLLLLVTLVALPALTLLSSVWRESRTERGGGVADRPRKPSQLRLCPTSGIT